MIPRRAFIKRSGKALQRTRVRSLVGSRMVDSKLERQTLEGLLLLERAGEIRNLRTQVTHQMYVGPLAMRDPSDVWIHALCSCQMPQGKPMPNSMNKIYSPRLDFQFEERKCGNRPAFIVNGSAHGNSCWEQIYADAKGWQDRQSAQFVAYKLFAAIHGQEIRLYRK